MLVRISLPCVFTGLGGKVLVEAENLPNNYMILIYLEKLVVVLDDNA